MSQTGIMDTHSSSSIDVRDMLCAQALAVVAQALARGRAGEALEVLYDAQDVKRDLLIWAKEQQYRLVEVGPETLRMTRETSA